MRGHASESALTRLGGAEGNMAVLLHRPKGLLGGAIYHGGRGMLDEDLLIGGSSDDQGHPGQERRRQYQLVL